MLPLSVVVLVKNEAKNIERCLQPWVGIVDEILVVDNGSTDETLALATKLGARSFITTWKGYGATKNEGNLQAHNDWILSLDADEVANEELVNAVKEIFTSSPNPQNIYAIQRKMVYAGAVLHYGVVQNEYRFRLFNRNKANWNNNAVHENLNIPKEGNKIKLNGFVWHYSYQSVEEHKAKIERYAQLSAQQMFEDGKQVSWLKLHGSPLFGFIKNYIFKLGFLDGRSGLDFALIEKYYTKQKYLLLQKLIKSKS